MRIEQDRKTSRLRYRLRPLRYAPAETGTIDDTATDGKPQGPVSRMVTGSVTLRRAR